MLPATILSIIGLGGLAAAVPHEIRRRQASGAQSVVYWGATTDDNPDLSVYCAAGAGINIIVLAFLPIYGASGNIPSGTIGACTVNTDGSFTSCDDLASQITTCKGAGVTVLLSLGGADGSYSLESESQAQDIGQYLWDAYGNSGNTTVQRPFGDVFINGIDFDLEANVGNQYYQYMITTLRAGFATDSGNTYYITGAPQCPLPEENMGEIIDAVAFDYLWVQFYNNNPTCSLGLAGDGPFNYDAWASYIATTASSGAKLFIGAPASVSASNSAEYLATPAEMATIVAQTQGNSTFGGVMLWDAGWSDQNVNDGCTYAQEVNSILTTGSPC